jgi:hypothetical protein
MRIRPFDDASGFLGVVEPALLAREAENALILGVALAVQAGRRYGDAPPFFSYVEDEGTLRAIAVCTPPYNLLLSSPSQSVEAVHLIANHLQAAGSVLPGVHGTVPVAQAFAETWCELAGVRAEAAMTQRLYRLSAVSSPEGVPGHFRLARAEEADLLSH